jgi:peroxiredoxin
MKKIKGFYTIIAIVALSLGLSAAVTETGSQKYGFKLPDVISGKTHALKDFTDAKAVAVIWVSTRCPVSNNYNKRMEALNKEYKAKGIVFLGINSNRMEDNMEIKKHAAENGFTFPVLKDNNNVIADHYKAERTPEVYVFNGKQELMYHGRIDDSQRAEKVTSNDLRSALDELLAGKPVSTKETKAFGCSIKRIKK